MGNILRKRKQPTEELEKIAIHMKELETQVKDHAESRSE